MRNRSKTGFLSIFEFFKGHDCELLKKNVHKFLEISETSVNIFR